MKSAEIERVSAIPVDPVAAMSAETLADAQRLLSYTPKFHRVYGVLTAWLSQTGIEPLNRTQVEAYKASMTRKSLSNKQLIFIGWLTTIVAAAGSTLTMHWFRATAFVGIVALIGSIIMAIIAEVTTTRWRERRWRAMPLEQFNGYVPPFALEKAIALKKLAMPSGTTISFQVEVLETYDMEILPDPFLVVQCGREAYYLDVWDEPEFEKKTRG